MTFETEDRPTRFCSKEQQKKNCFDLGHLRVARSVVRDYAICGGIVQRQVTWIADQKLDAHEESHWTYLANVSSITNNKIPDYFLCLLKNKGYDLPSGQSITAGVDCIHPSGYPGQAVS